MLGLEESFQGTCFGHAFSKAYQYATTEENFCKDLRLMICVNQICSKRFIELHNLAKKI